jgi:cobalt-zinc-cadmium efflux system outer membrane protein
VLENGLSEDEAVAIALWNNAALSELLADLGFSRADVVQAGLLSNPGFSVLFPLGPKQLEFTAKLPVEALWLRPKRVAAATRNAERVAEGLVQSGLDLVRDVKLAVTEVRLAERRVELANQAARLAAEVADLAESRLRAGEASALEAAAPRVDALLAREEAARLPHDVRLAWTRLRALLGPTFTETPLALGPAAPAVGLPSDPVALVEMAVASRPDVRAAELAIEAGRERVGLSRWEAITVSGLADANGKGSQGFEIGPGMDVAVPIFNWNQGGMARADAELTRAVRHFATVRQRVALEVSEAHTRWRKAAEQAAVWSDRVIPELEDGVRRAERAYAAGDVSFLLMLQTTAQLVHVRGRAAEAEAEMARARAELERSVGRRLDDGHGAPPS